MEEYGLLITITYLHAIFVLVSKSKNIELKYGISKVIFVLLTGVSLYFMFVKEDDLLWAKIVIFLPVIYFFAVLYFDEIAQLLKKLKIVRVKNKAYVVDNELAEQLIDAVDYLSKRRIGALITIERKVDLSKIINKALIINADVSKELLTSIFIPNAPMHDGAVIIRGNKILCAKAYYPASNRTDLPMHFGTRHRAAIGISEVSDAFTIIVSEETGNVSITINKAIEYNISKETLSLYFEKFLQVF
jgi:diadenylate cyclase